MFTDQELAAIHEALSQFVQNTEELEGSSDPLSRTLCENLEPARSAMEKLDARMAALAELAERNAREAAEQAERDRKADERPPEIELHLSADPDFTRKGWARKVRSIGGRYNECRAHGTQRFVHLPTTPEALALANALHRTFGTARQWNGVKNATTWIARGVHHSAQTLAYVPNAAEDPAAFFLTRYRQQRARRGA